MRQLAARGSLAPADVEAIWQNYTQRAKPALEIAAAVGRAAEWQHSEGGWRLIAAAEACLLRAVAEGEAKLKAIPKAARLWFREHRDRLGGAVVEHPPGTLRKPEARPAAAAGPTTIAGDGVLEIAMVRDKKAFLLGANTIISGPYTARAHRGDAARWLDAGKAAKQVGRPVGKVRRRASAGPAARNAR